MTPKSVRMIYHWELQNKKCYYCDTILYHMTTAGLEILNCNIDHKVPLSRKGKDDFENTCLTCLSCNSIKGNLTEEEFKQISDKLKSGTMKHKDLSEYRKYLELKAKFEPDFHSETKVVIEDRIPLSGLEAEFNKL